MDTKWENEPFVIGVDFGTGSCKSVILSVTGTVLGIGSGDYFAQNFHAQWEEQNPESLINGMILSVRKAIQSTGVHPDACIGLSIGGALHSLVALDKKNRPLTGIMTWADGRAIKQVKEISQRYDMHEHYLHSGCPNHPMYPISKIIWLREEVPEVFRYANWFISAKEYVIFRLTGRHIVDYNTASGTGLLDTRNLVWDDISLKMAGIQPEWLSKLEDPQNIIGQVDARLTARMRLRNNTPIILGGADAVNSSLGSGAVHTNQLTCMVGTSGAMRVIVKQPVFDPQERIWCYAIDSSHWLVGGAINNGGLALWWLQNAFSQGKREPPTNKLEFVDIITWAEEIEAGAEGVICLPFFTNERSPNWNPNARAVFFGLTLQHDQRHMARAVLESVGFRLRSVLDVLKEVIGEPGEIRASGGFIQSKLWVQVITDVFDKNLLIPAQKETSSVGAAFWALLGTKVVDRIESLSSYVNILTTFKPDRDANRTYESRYMVYKELYDSLQVLYNRSILVD